MELRQLIAVLFLTTAIAPASEIHVEQVFDRVAATFQLRDGRKPPTLRVSDSKKSTPFKGAYFDGDSREVVVDEQLLDRFRADPTLGDDALAFVVSHELAHFYGNHRLALGAASTSETSPQEAHIRRSLEEEADRNGLLHSHLAGYRGATVAPLAIRSLYGFYGLASNQTGYPTLEARVEATKAVVAGLRPLLPLYPLAMSLIATEHLAEAALVLGYLADRFQSSDLFHNAAVLQARIGLSNTPNSARYAALYPFLYNTENNLAHGLGGLRGGNQDAKPYLDAAESQLRQLHRQTSHDPAVRINLALVLDLLGRPREGLTLLAEDAGFPLRFHAHRLTAQAILLHHSGQTTRAKRAVRASLGTRATLWEAFFRNAMPGDGAVKKPEPACPDLRAIANRVEYGSSSLWTQAKSIPRFGRVPGDTYDLTVEATETENALAARVRSYQSSLRMVLAKTLSIAEQQLLSDYVKRTEPSIELVGHPINYHLYGNPQCRFVLAIRDGIVVELAFLEHRW